MRKCDYYDRLRDQFEAAYDVYQASEYEDTTEIFSITKELREKADYRNNLEEME